MHPCASSSALQAGSFEIRLAERLLLIEVQPAKLGARAFDLLAALVERRERTDSRNELLDIVWPGVVVEENNLQVQICTRRKLLGPQTVATIPGRGDRFTTAARDREAPADEAVPSAGSRRFRPGHTASAGHSC